MLKSETTDYFKINTITFIEEIDFNSVCFVVELNTVFNCYVSERQTVLSSTTKHAKSNYVSILTSFSYFYGFILVRVTVSPLSKDLVTLAYSIHVCTL